MRPALLNSYFSDVSVLPGIGPKAFVNYRRLLGTSEGETPRVLDLAFHMPTGVIDRRFRPTIAEARPGAIVTLKVRVVEHRAPPRNSRAPYRVLCEDESGDVTLVFFHGHGSYLEKQLPPGEIRIVSGKFEFFNNHAQIVHPDHIVSEAEAARLPLIEPVYSLTGGISAAMLRKVLTAALPTLGPLPEWIDPSLIRTRDWPDFRGALGRLHTPDPDRRLRSGWCGVEAACL